MIDVATSVIAEYASKSVWEIIAVVLALAYLLLALKGSLWCWPAALVSTAIYTVLFWKVSLLMDSALNVYYIAMAVYGWWSWRRVGPQKTSIRISTWSVQRHVLVILVVVVCSVLSGSLLDRYSGAAWPYLDSFTTWASVLTTYMVAKKILENWVYWIVIDTVAMGLYVERGLYATAALFFLYLIICVFGFMHWRKMLAAERAINEPKFA